MALSKLPVTVDFVSKNRSLHNTTFTSPDGRDVFVIETLRRCWPDNFSSTVSMRDPQSGQTILLAKLEFKPFSADLLTFKQQQPVAVKKWMPRGRFGHFSK